MEQKDFFLVFSALNNTFECLKHVESHECRIKYNIWYYKTNLQPSFAILEEIELVLVFGVML